VPGLNLPRRVRAVVQHLAAELMAEHDIARQIHRLAAHSLGHPGHVMGVLAGVEIGAADAAGERFHQHLPCRRLRLGQRVDDDLAVPENRSTHQSPSMAGGCGRKCDERSYARRHDALPGIAYHALAGIGPVDVGELALEDGGPRPAVEPLHLAAAVVSAEFCGCAAP